MSKFNFTNSIAREVQRASLSSYRKKLSILANTTDWLEEQLQSSQKRFQTAEGMANGTYEHIEDRHFSTVRGNLAEKFLSKVAAEALDRGVFDPAVSVFEKVVLPRQKGRGKVRGAYDFRLVLSGRENFLEITTLENTKNRDGKTSLRMVGEDAVCRTILMGRRSFHDWNHQSRVVGREQLARVLFGPDGVQALEPWEGVSREIVSEIEAIRSEYRPQIVRKLYGHAIHMLGGLTRLNESDSASFGAVDNRPMRTIGVVELQSLRLLG